MDVVYVKYDANVPVGGGALRTVLRGQHWPADDPVVKAMPDAFSPDPRYGIQWTGSPPPELAEAPVEQATAAPGEKRNVRRG
jgi:hypothetical protein